MGRFGSGLVSLAGVFLLGASSGKASEVHIFEHNRSVIEWVFAGDRVRATYLTPRAGMERAGVSAGTLLFEGEDRGGGKIIGEAYTFKEGCPPEPYKVIGDWDGDWITLRGPAPTRGSGCDVTGYTLDSPHAVLKFRYSGTDH